MRLDKLTTKFQEALTEAQSLAVTRDNPYIEPAHILLAMLLHVTDRERSLCASRLAVCRDAPRRVLRYLAQWRVTVACTLLRKGKPVALVANEVGYGGPTALARAFRSVHGLSPREWIQRERRGETASDV